MRKTENRTEQHTGVVYQVRTLPNRWVEPMGSEVISTHDSAQAALAAYEAQRQTADDGTGRSTYGSFVPSIVVRVDGDGGESVTVRRPLAAPRTESSGGGRW
jgi:hypothetical protein